MEYEVKSSKLGQSLCKKNCQAHKLNREDATDRSR